MISQQYQVLEAYKEWLDLPYQCHLTTRLPTSLNRHTAQQIQRWHTRHVLVPLAHRLNIKLAAVSVIMTNREKHIHSLLYSPDKPLELGTQWIDAPYADCHGILATVINDTTLDYVFNHLIHQGGHLHFFNKNYLPTKE
jgi:hypothetical protein